MLTNSNFTALKEGEKGGVVGLSKRKGSECWQMCFFLEGRRVRMSTGTANKRLAEKVWEKKKAEIVTGEIDRATETRPNLLFSELVEEFLGKHCRVEKSSWKRDETIARALCAHFGTHPIGRIKPYDILAWREKRAGHITRTGSRITRASLNRELAFLKTMFSLAVEWGWLRENPAKRVRKLKGEAKRLRFLTRAEFSRLLAYARPSLRPILLVAVMTGMRKSEILNLKWKHVDFVNNLIRVANTKNNDSRDVPFGFHVREVLLGLKRGKKAQDSVFSRKNGEPIRCVKEAFKAACDRAGIVDFRFHDLRHTAASLLAAGGCDIITLQHILGHKTLAMTQRYAHLVPGRYEKPREIMNAFWSGDDGEVGATKLPQLVVPKNSTSVSH